jgi:AcrR family transcriptional regulator
VPRTGLTAEEIRERAIEIAQEQLRKHGFEKLRFSEVAKRIGVSHVALYAHFKDKSELLEAVTERWLVEMDAALEMICLGSGDALKRIEKWFTLLHRYKIEKVKNDPELFKAFDSSSESKKPSVQRHLNNLETQIMGLLREAYSSRLLTKNNPRKAYIILNEALVGFYHPRILVLHLHEKRDAILKKTLHTLLKGLT